jgi:hypothetical protein
VEINQNTGKFLDLEHRNIIQIERALEIMFLSV